VKDPTTAWRHCHSHTESTHADRRAEHACRPSCGARMPTVVRDTPYGLVMNVLDELPPALRRSLVAMLQTGGSHSLSRSADALGRSADNLQW
jgi:hypothetical protein